MLQNYKAGRCRLLGGASAAVLAASALSANTALAQQVDSSTADGDEIIVVGRKYFTDQTSLTRAPAEITEIPNTLTVVNDQLLTDQLLPNFRDALNNVAGAQAISNIPGLGDRLTIRGLTGGSVNSLVRENGLSGGVNYPVDPFLIQRIEVIKGPTSIAGGGAPVGGLINRVLKTPFEGTARNLTVLGNTFGNVRAGLDLNDRLDEDGDLHGRIVIAGAVGEQARDREEENHIAVLPSIKYDLSEKTTVTVLGQYFQNGGALFRGVGGGEAFNGSPPVDPRFNWNFDENDLVSDTRHLSIQADIVHDFLDDLSLTARVGQAETDIQWSSIYSFNYGAGLPASGDARIYAGANTADNERFAADVFLTKTFRPFNGLESSIVVGADRVEQKRDGFQTYQFLGTDNIFNPQVRFDVPDDILENIDFNRRNVDLRQTGVYNQIVLRLTDRAALITGVRYDWLTQSSVIEGFLAETGESTSAEGPETSDSAFTWRAGGSYEVGFDTTLYASYSESFISNAFAFTVSREFLDAEKGRQIEAGFKSTVLGDNLLLTGSVFQITRDNVASPDPVSPGFSLPLGEQRTRGFEIEAFGEILPGWNVALAYSYLDAKVTEDGDDALALEGTPLAGVAQNQFNLFTTYEIQEGPLRGLGGGFQIFHRGEVPLIFNGPPESIESGFWTLDINLFYRDIFDGVDLRAAIENVTDERYVPAPFSYNNFIFGAPLNATVSVSVDF